MTCGNLHENGKLSRVILLVRNGICSDFLKDSMRPYFFVIIVAYYAYYRNMLMSLSVLFMCMFQVSFSHVHKTQTHTHTVVERKRLFIVLM